MRNKSDDRADVSKAGKSKSNPTCRGAHSIRIKRAQIAALLSAVSCGIGLTHAFADTAATFSTGTTDLSNGSNYTPNINPTAASAYDLELTGTYGTTTLNTNGAALVFGALDDLNNQALTISNSSGTASSISLNTTSNSLGSAADLLYVQGGGTLNIASGAGSLGLILGAAGNFDVAGTANISSAISGSGAGFTKTGGGMLSLGGANTFSGNVTFSGGGTIQLGSSSVGTPGTVGSNGALTSGALGTGALIINTSAGTLDLNGQTLGNRFSSQVNNTFITNTSSNVATVSGAFDGSLTSNVISDFIVGGNSGSIIFTGKISRTSGTVGFTKTGTDTVTFEEGSANAGIGSQGDQVKVSAGILALGVTGTSAGAFADSVTVQGGTLQFAPGLGTVTGGSLWGGQINGNLQITSGTVDLNGSSGQNSRQQQLYGTGGTITNSSATPGVIGISARNNSEYTFAGTVRDGAGTTGVDFSSQGTTGSGRINEFTGTNTYSGPTSISYGCFELGNALAAQNSVITINAASGLGSSGTSSSNNGTIPVITTSYPLSFAGSIGTFTVGGLSGAGNLALTDIGYSSAFVAGTAATVSLQVGSSLATNASPAAYTGVIGDGTVAGGTVTKIGTSTEIFSGNNTYTGSTSISNGTLSVGTVNTGTNSQPLGANATLNLGGASTFGTLQYTGTSGTLDKAITLGAAGGGIATSTVTSPNFLTLSGLISGSGSLVINDTGAGSVQLSNGSNTIAGGTVIQSGQVYTGSTTGFGTGTITLGASSGSNSATAKWNLNGTIANNIVVASGSSGTLKLSSVWGGGNGVKLSGAVTLNNNLTLGEDYSGNSSSYLQLTGQITGSSNITVSNATSGTNNSVFLTGNNASTFTGNVLITNGSTLYTANNALGASNTVAVDSGSQLNINGQSLTVAGLINGSSGAGSVVISNTTGQTFTVAGTSSYTFGGTISNAANLTVATGATQTLTGSSTYTGATSINGGTLTVDASSNASASIAGTKSIAVNATGTLHLITVVGGSGTGGATVALANSAATVTAAVPANVGTPLQVPQFNLELNGNTQTIASFTIGSFGEPAGYYGSSAFFTATGYSPADSTTDGYFTGDGGFSVAPEPTVTGMLGMAAGLSLLRRRRRLACVAPASLGV